MKAFIPIIVLSRRKPGSIARRHDLLKSARASDAPLWIPAFAGKGGRGHTTEQLNAITLVAETIRRAGFCRRSRAAARQRLVRSVGVARTAAPEREVDADRHVVRG